MAKRDAESMLILCCANVADIGPTLNQLRRLDIYLHEFSCVSVVLAITGGSVSSVATLHGHEHQRPR